MNFLLSFSSKIFFDLSKAFIPVFLLHYILTYWSGFILKCLSAEEGMAEGGSAFSLTFCLSFPHFLFFPFFDLWISNRRRSVYYAGIFLASCVFSNE